MSLGGSGGGFGLEANLKTFSDEKREFWRPVDGVAIVVVDELALERRGQIRAFQIAVLTLVSLAVLLLVSF